MKINWVEIQLFSEKESVKIGIWIFFGYIAVNLALKLCIIAVTIDTVVWTEI